MDGVASSSSSSSGKSSASSSSSSSSSSGSSDQAFDMGGGKRGRTGEWLEIVPGGAKVKVNFYKPKGKKAYTRLIVACPTHGPACQKKRNITHTKQFGKIEPLGYLLAWSRMGVGVDKAGHCKRTFKVPLARVQECCSELKSKVDHILDTY